MNCLRSKRLKDAQQHDSIMRMQGDGGCTLDKQGRMIAEELLETQNMPRLLSGSLPNEYSGAANGLRCFL